MFLPQLHSRTRNCVVLTFVVLLLYCIVFYSIHRCFPHFHSGMKNYVVLCYIVIVLYCSIIYCIVVLCILFVVLCYIVLCFIIWLTDFACCDWSIPGP